MLKEYFIDTAQSYGLTERERFTGAVRDDLSIEKRRELLKIREQTNGMERITALAINMLFPAAIVILIFVCVTQSLLIVFDVNSLYDLLSDTMCGMFDHVHNEFLKGLLYKFSVFR